MEYIYGNIFGLSQIIIGYPFDTLKTCLQNNNNINIYLEKPKLLYNGIKYPMIMNCIGTGLMFGNYNHYNSYFNNSIIAGICTGFTGSFLITPFDYLKLHSQIYFTNEKKKLTPKLLYTGLQYTICREIISIPCYFSTYHYLNNNYRNKYIFTNPFIFGGLAGMTSWLCTYPIDTLKTRKQLDYSKSFKELYKMGKLFNGLEITLLRAFIVNGFSFYIYDKLQI